MSLATELLVDAVGAASRRRDVFVPIEIFNTFAALAAASGGVVEFTARYEWSELQPQPQPCPFAAWTALYGVWDSAPRPTGLPVISIVHLPHNFKGAPLPTSYSIMEGVHLHTKATENCFVIVTRNKLTWRGVVHSKATRKDYATIICPAEAGLASVLVMAAAMDGTMTSVVPVLDRALCRLADAMSEAGENS